mmetsp:Transcript_295/g.534  ORF Transcript_295/g.534 Transcript_295/m.534 type:complete len:294 (-) Transcript_295:561-1442(-)
MITKAPQFRGVMSWIQTILIFQLVKDNATILDLDGADGIHIGKYQRHRKKVKEYICVSEHEKESKAAQDKWTKKGKPFHASFYKQEDINRLLDYKQTNKETTQKKKQTKIYDHIVAFGGTLEEYCGAEMSKRDIGEFLKAIKQKLNPQGGTAFGIVMDDSTMWSRYETSSMEKHFGVFDVHYVDATQKRIELAIEKEKKPYVGTPIHCPTLMQQASEVGLEICNLTNCYDLFLDYQHIYKMDLDAFQVFRSNPTLRKADVALLQMFHIVVIRRHEALEESIQFCHSVLKDKEP